MAQKVSGYTRKPYRQKGKLIKPKRTKTHNRRKRKKGKKRIIGKKPIKLYPIYNENGERLGWKRKR